MIRIIVTGATGFIGSRLVPRLLDRGHLVGAILRPGTPREAVDKRAIILDHDGSVNSMYDLVEHFEPNAAIHLATHFVANHNPDDIEKLITSNLGFGCQLLDALHRCRVAKLVNFGTAWQHYGSASYCPVSLYAATKQAFEDLATYYTDAGGLHVLTLKLADTYGPGDTRAKLVPMLCRAAHTGEEVLLSPGEQFVNFTYIEDVLAAVEVALCRQSTDKQAYFSLMGPESISLRDFVTLFEHVAGKALNIKWGARPYRPREVMQPWTGVLLPDWMPKWRLSDGLRTVL